MTHFIGKHPPRFWAGVPSLRDLFCLLVNVKGTGHPTEGMDKTRWEGDEVGYIPSWFDV
jgi:hypothetical protein